MGSSIGADVPQAIAAHRYYARELDGGCVRDLGNRRNAFERLADRPCFRGPRFPRMPRVHGPVHRFTALFWTMTNASLIVSALLLCTAGFFIYGPQALVAIIAANLATKKAAGSAVGLTGLFGYLSTVVSGVGVGWLAETHGWDAAFRMFIVAALASAALFAACWPASAHGYGDNQHEG